MRCSQSMSIITHMGGRSLQCWRSLRVRHPPLVDIAHLLILESPEAIIGHVLVDIASTPQPMRGDDSDSEADELALPSIVSLRASLIFALRSILVSNSHSLSLDALCAALLIQLNEEMFRRLHSAGLLEQFLASIVDLVCLAALITAQFLQSQSGPLFVVFSPVPNRSTCILTINSRTWPRRA